MTTRHLYLARHGAADPFGEPTEAGRRQAAFLGERLAAAPVDVVWHSPLPRAAASARLVTDRLPAGTPVIEAPELIDHVPYVPDPHETPEPWLGFFDGYDADDAAAGHAIAHDLVARFASVDDTAKTTHEVLITHAYPIAWLLRDALGAPPVRWLGLNPANAALTVVEHRPGLPPEIVMFNDMSHLPADLRWTGFATTTRP